MRIILAAALLTCLLLCLSCTRKIYVPVERVRTEYRDADTSETYARLLRLIETRKESTATADSFARREKETVVLTENGDTARHYRFEYVSTTSKRETELESALTARDSTIRDLRARLVSVKTDSVPVPYPVEKKLTKWQQIKVNYGGKALGALALMGAFVLIRLVLRLKLPKSK